MPKLILDFLWPKIRPYCHNSAKKNNAAWIPNPSPISDPNPIQPLTHFALWNSEWTVETWVWTPKFLTRETPCNPLPKISLQQCLQAFGNVGERMGCFLSIAGIWGSRALSTVSIRTFAWRCTATRMTTMVCCSISKKVTLADARMCPS